MNILYLAVADARGHLMRAQLLAKTLREENHQVELLTTSEAGIKFLAQMQESAKLISPEYYVVFDENQNMQKVATDLRVLAYILLPWRMLKDIIQLKRYIAENKVDLMINDSLHPALLFAPFYFGWRCQILHVHGETLLHALKTNFTQRLPAFLANLFAKTVDRVMSHKASQLIHGQHITEPVKLANGNGWYLPNPVAKPTRVRKQTLAMYQLAGLSITDLSISESSFDELSESAQQHEKQVALIYLNPHFQNETLVLQLERSLLKADWDFIGISEYFSGRKNWIAQTDDFANLAFAADMLISAPGMALLQIARILQKPTTLLLTAQPEQLANAKKFGAQQVSYGFCEIDVMSKSEVAYQAFEQLIQQCSRPVVPESIVAETVANADHEECFKYEVQHLQSAQNQIEQINAYWIARIEEGNLLSC